MNSRRLWNSHQRHKFFRAEASRDILKFRVLEMAFPGVFKWYFPPQMLPVCCFARIVATLGANYAIETVRTILSMSSMSLKKLKHRCFTVLCDGAYFLLAVMVEGDESSRLRVAITSRRFWLATSPYWQPWQKKVMVTNIKRFVAECFPGKLNVVNILLWPLFTITRSLVFCQLVSRVARTFVAKPQISTNMLAMTIMIHAFIYSFKKRKKKN